MATVGRASAPESVKSALEKGGLTAAVREVLGGTIDDKGKGNAMMKGPGGAKSSRTETVDTATVELVGPRLPRTS